VPPLSRLARAGPAPRIVPFFLFIAALGVRAALAGGPGIDLPWFYGLQAGSAGLALWYYRAHFTELRPPALRLRPAALAVSLGALVFLAWVAPLPGWMRLPSESPPFLPIEPATGALRWDLILLRSAGAVLVVPLMEELFWRSFLMRWIDRRDFLSFAPTQASLLAIAASSAVFALEHDFWAPALLAGFLYAGVYRVTGNLWNAVIAHATTNLLLAIWVVFTHSWSYW